jgi:hypothetical protein
VHRRSEGEHTHENTTDILVIRMKENLWIQIHGHISEQNKNKNTYYGVAYTRKPNCIIVLIILQAVTFDTEVKNIS